MARAERTERAMDSAAGGGQRLPVRNLVRAWWEPAAPTWLVPFERVRAAAESELCRG